MYWTAVLRYVTCSSDVACLGNADECDASHRCFTGLLLSISFSLSVLTFNSLLHCLISLMLIAATTSGIRYCFHCHLSVCKEVNSKRYGWVSVGVRVSASALRLAGNRRWHSSGNACVGLKVETEISR